MGAELGAEVIKQAQTQVHKLHFLGAQPALDCVCVYCVPMYMCVYVCMYQ